MAIFWLLKQVYLFHTYHVENAVNLILLPLRACEQELSKKDYNYKIRRLAAGVCTPDLVFFPWQHWWLGTTVANCLLCLHHLHVYMFFVFVLPRPRSTVWQ